jgi:rubredoxin
MKSINKCRQCGAKSYKPVIERDGLGVMRPSGKYQCTGCKLVFETVGEWRSGVPAVVNALRVSSTDDQDGSETA